MSTYAVSAPPSANRMRTRTWHGYDGKSNEYTAWLRNAGTELLAQKATPIHGEVAITVIAPANGRRDLDNHIKPTCDLLCKMKLIDGDRFKTVKRIVLEWHNQPAMLITISKWNGDDSNTATELPSPATAKRHSGRSSGL